MGGKRIKSSRKAHGVGFVACFRGREIAFAREFDTLANKPSVKGLLGDKDLLIKHTVPEGMIAVY